MSADDPAAVDRAEALLDEGRAAEALTLVARPALAKDASHAALATYATALKALGRREEALAFNQRAADRYPTSLIAWHNLAATLGDLGRGSESKAAVEKAMDRGLDAPETWLVYARALLAVGDVDNAQRAYDACQQRAGGDAEVAVERANLVWMRSGDLTAAQAVLDAAFQAGGPPGALVMAKARLFDAADQGEAALRLLSMAAERMADDVTVLINAAQAAVEHGDVPRAKSLAARARSLAPQDLNALNQMVIVMLAAGEADQALALAREGLAIQPDHQSLTGWAATAARVVSDPLHDQLYDLDNLVGVYDIETPSSWPNLAAYLADLAKALAPMHAYAHHPFHQSLREGSQTAQALTAATHPTLAAFFQAIDGPIRQHITRLGPGSDAFRRRNTGAYRIHNTWSVLLRPGGFHKDHFHPDGWLSSAFYLETPDQALDTGAHEGWLRFGQPPIQLTPPLPALRHVRPQPGRLVLFPSYMWHGTVPFHTDERRLTLAFDAVPV